MRILIFGAMNVETEFMISKLKDTEKTEVAGYPFHKGTIGDKEIIICRTFTGMENSAAATAIGILTFKPDCIISQGTAGGHNPKLHQNDIVVADRLINISSFQTERYGKGEGSHPEKWKMMEWDLFDGAKQSGSDIATSLHSDKKLMELALSTEYNEGRLVMGTISSSDNWNREMDRINHLVEEYGSDCEEMESYAATQIAERFKVPIITIRIISNSEQHPAEEYDRNIGITCQKFVLDFIEKLA